MSNIDADEIQATLDALHPEERGLFAEAVLGKDAVDFVSTELGQYVIGRVKQELAVSHEKLKGVSAWRIFKVQELQNEIWRAEQFLEWLRDLIVSGTRATQVLNQEDE